MDTNKMPEEMRAEFVRAFTNQFGFGVLTASADADAANMLKAAAWAWQTSREAVVVDLSDLSRCFSPNDCGDWAMWLDDVKKMIQAQGLKVNP